MDGTNNGIPGRASTNLVPCGFSTGYPGSAGDYDLVIPSTDIALTGTLCWQTDEDWPTSLPGTAA